MDIIIASVSGLLITFYTLCICVGLGIGMQKIIFRNKIQSLSTFFYTGCIFLIPYLQVWHLFFPVNINTWVIPSVLGMSGLGVYCYYNKIKYNPDKNIVIGFVFFIILSLYFTLQSFYDKFTYDALTYYIQTIRWYKQEAIIPGHANLFLYFGLNQSWFLMGAFFDSLPDGFRGLYITNAVFLSIASFFHASRMIDSFQRKQYNMMVFSLLALFLLLKTLPNQINIPATDIAILIITLEIFTHIARMIFFRRITISTFIYMFSLCMIGMSIKLSMIGLCAGLCVFALWKWNIFNVIRKNRVTLCFSLSILLIWMLRGVIISGYPLYPFPGIRLPVDWLADYETAVNFSSYIKIFAITHTHGIEAADFHLREWIGHWALDTIKKVRTIIFLMGFSALLIHFYLYKRKKSEILAFMSIPFISISFWLFTAPDIRFNTGLFWGIGSIGIALWATGLKTYSRYLWVIPLITMMFYLNSIWVPNPTLPPFPCMKTTLSSGFEVYVPMYPEAGEWRIASCPLPSSVLPNQNLRLRGKSYKEGFTISPK